MNLSLPAKKMAFLVVIITAILIVAGIVLCLAVPSMTPGDIIPVTLGILLLALINIAKVLLLERQVNKLSTMTDPGKAKLYTIGQVLFRFVLTAGGLVAAHFLRYLFPAPTHYALYAALISAFAWNIAAYLLKFMKLDADTDNE